MDEREEGKKIVVKAEGVNSWKPITYVKVGTMIFLTILVCILCFFIIYRYEGIVDMIARILKAGESIIMGLVIAYLLSPMQNFFERGFRKSVLPKMKSQKNAKKISRVVGIAGAIIVFLLIITFLIIAIVPSVVNSIKSLAETMPENMKNFKAWVNGLNIGGLKMTKDIEEYMEDAVLYLRNWVSGDGFPEAQLYVTQITTGVYSVVRSVFNFIIGIVVAVYVMAIKETLIGQSKKVIFAIFKPKRANMIVQITRQAHKVFGGFIIGKIIDSLIIGVLCYIGCLILRIPEAVLISTIVGVTNVIPVFGPLIGAVPCVLLLLVQSPIHALYFAIFVLALQQVDGNIIGPWILGDSTGLSSFWVMFAILLFGGLYGFMGMLLGVPIMGMIYYLSRRLTNYGLRKKSLPEETFKYIDAKYIDEEHSCLTYDEGKEPQEEETAQESQKDLPPKKKPRLKK